MIVDAILGVLCGLFATLLAPLEVINIGIDLISSIPIITSFIQVIAYIFPWVNILPIFILIIVIMSFKLVIATITAIWDIIPFVR